jgi:hypothetical protein
MKRAAYVGIAAGVLVMLTAAGRTGSREPAGGAAGSLSIDPRGVYFNSFTIGATISGTQWWQVIPLPGAPNQYRLASIFGVGFNGTITADGVITLDGGAGMGSFSNPDEFILDGGASSNACFRAPFTDPDFPLTLTTPVLGNPLLSDAWLSVTEAFDPHTGRSLGQTSQNLTVAVEGDTFRITIDEDGTFYQGVFDTHLRVGFRVVEPAPTNPSFQSFEGSSTNAGMNVLGEATLLGTNHFNAVILLQSLDPVGAQTQQLLRFSAARVDPINPADLNADGKVDGVDLGSLLLQWGKCSKDVFCQPDFNGSGIVDGSDLGLLLLNWTG